MALGVVFDIFAKDKTGQAFDQVKNKVRQLDDSFAKLKKAAVVFGGGAAVFNWLKGAAEGAEHINDLSVRLGIGADVLSQYQLVAGETGVELDSIAKGMQMLAKNSVEAASGSGAASEALAKLGIDAATFKNLSIDQQFAMVAEKIQGIQNPADRVSIAMALMGKSGAEMLQVMQNGGEGLLEMQRKADGLGITLNNTTTGAIDSMMDAFGNLGLQVVALGQHLIAKFAPILEFIAEVLQVVLAGAIVIVRDDFKSMVQVILNAIGAIANGLSWLTEQLSILPGEVGASFQALSDSLKDYGDVLSNVNADTGTMVETQKKLPPVLDETAQGFEKVGKASKKTADESKKDFDVLQRELERGATNIQDQWIDSLLGIGGGFDSLRDTALSSLKEIGAAMLKNLMNQAFGMGGQSNLPWLNQGGASGGGGFGGIFGDLVGGLGSFFGGFFADGGNFMGGKPIMVGERGAEMIVPRAGGTVIPNHAMGGKTIVNMNITTPDVNSFKRSQSQIAAAMAESVRRGSRNL